MLQRHDEIEVFAEPIQNESLPRTAGQWHVRVRNASDVLNTFSFAITKIRLKAVSAEPSQLTLMPRQEKSALLTIYMPKEVEAKTYSFVLGTFSHLNILEQTQIQLQLEIPSPAGDVRDLMPLPDIDWPVHARSIGPIPIELVASRGRLSFTPGSQDLVDLHIRNSSGSHLLLELFCEGLPDTWISLTSTRVAVPSRNSAKEAVILSPPSNVPSGIYPLTIGAQVLPHAAIAVRLNLMVQVGDGGPPPNFDVTPKTNEATVSSSTSNSAGRTLRVFLCHSSGDKQSVRDLYHHLRDQGYAPWLDEEELLGGQDWDQEIRKAVRTSDVVVVCLSKASITKAGYVQKELRFALDVADEQPEGTIFLIPVKLEECEVPARLRKWQWINLFEERGLERLLRALNARAATIK